MRRSKILHLHFRTILFLYKKYDNKISSSLQFSKEIFYNKTHTRHRAAKFQRKNSILHTEALYVLRPTLGLNESTNTICGKFNQMLVFRKLRS